jgi:hypothetical protein
VLRAIYRDKRCVRLSLPAACVLFYWQALLIHPPPAARRSTIRIRPVTTTRICTRY